MQWIGRPFVWIENGAINILLFLSIKVLSKMTQDASEKFDNLWHGSHVNTRENMFTCSCVFEFAGISMYSVWNWDVADNISVWDAIVNILYDSKTFQRKKLGLPSKGLFMGFSKCHVD